MVRAIGTGPVTGELSRQLPGPRKWDQVPSGTYEAAHITGAAVYGIKRLSDLFVERFSMVLPIENPTKSYWIEAAKSPLRNFRSNDKVPVETDVVVIGSGYAGVTTAYWIHKVSHLKLDL